MEKCLVMLNTQQFRKLNKDSIKIKERKLQRFLKKIKNKLQKQPFSTWVFTLTVYWILSFKKFILNDTVDLLPIRPMVSYTPLLAHKKIYILTGYQECNIVQIAILILQSKYQLCDLKNNNIWLLITLVSHILLV